MDLPAEAVLAYATIREALPHVIKAVPKLRDMIAGHTAAQSAKVVSDAQAAVHRANADATTSAAWAEFAAVLREERAREYEAHEAQRERERLTYEARIRAVEAAERECQKRADSIERKARQDVEDLRVEFFDALRRAHGRATPSSGHSVVVEPADPSAAVTPPLGHRLVPEPIPRLPSQDPENTDSLPPTPGTPNAV